MDKQRRYRRHKGLGHARLSIIDLSPTGLQPLHSEDEKVHVVVNGEIYDHVAIRGRCSVEFDYNFSGRSDSEVILALYQHHGVPGLFEHLRGEFAFVLYDERSGDVIAARDRFGIKPLFWTYSNETPARLLLASEIKGFLPMGWEPEWDVDAISSGAAVLGEGTLFKGAKKVLPGHWVRFGRDGSVTQHRYWDAEYADKTVKEARSMDDMVNGVRERLVNAVRLRLQADVPVGIYLSGGLDSSIVAGITTQLVRERGVKLGNQDIKDRITCFSISFTSDSEYNEYDIAKRTAEWLDLNIVKKVMDDEELAKHFADSVYHTEHHHFDMNSVGKYALSNLPRQQGIPVVLTGEGADEHFAGYPFLVSDFLREPDDALPSTELAKDTELREALYKSAAAQLRSMYKGMGMFDHARTEESTDFDALAGLDAFLIQWRSFPSSDVFAPWVRDKQSASGVYAALLDSIPPDAQEKIQDRWHSLHSALYVFVKSSMANMVLTCLGDRSEMAHSIEARLPFLDHELAEYVNGLPPSVKMSYRAPDPVGVNDDGGDKKKAPQSLFWENMAAVRDRIIDKKVLREAGRPFITDEIYNRKKHPYSSPWKWPVDGPIYRMFRSLLTKEAVDRLGFVDFGVISRCLDAAFGDAGDSVSFRKLVVVGAWVVLSQRFGVKSAVPRT
ncbi:asparagine synthetase [Colletotrichum phormii]|uniref:Asparagine synthetase n=1 Tax=Colletotrichum phormii TaxID=359342 RepID=A0AAI9ZSI5_9PEZI|nr:asparagine synthetase [Colletotrichum phormii]KAK1637303.1 asparagine synthetase [Colletotrichum phormii]